MADDRYIHGTEPAEQSRLARLNARLNDSCLARLELRQGMRVLDVGCGLGQMARAMGRRVAPGGSVIAVDRDERQLTEARRLAGEAGEEGSAEFRAGEANALPLQPEEFGAFDLVFCRFVLEHLRRPLEAVREMVRALRPGGVIALADDDHGLWHMHPPCAEFERTWSAYRRGWVLAGLDERIGSKLPELIAAAGGRPRGCDFVFFGGCQGAPDWDDLVTNMIEVVRTGRGTVSEHGVLDPELFDAGLIAAREWSRRPGASVWFPMCWAWASNRLDRGADGMPPDCYVSSSASSSSTVRGKSSRSSRESERSARIRPSVWQVGQ